MSLTVLITRPENAALRFADALRVRWGCAVQIMIAPLMRITYMDAPLDLDGVDTLIFTSAQGVAAFARLSARRDLRCYAVGRATAEAAAAEGFDAIAADGDATSLCARIIDDGVRGQCLHLRGAHAAGDVTGTLREAGIAARAQIVYQQEKVPLTSAALALLDGPGPVLLPLFSPRSAALFFEQARPSAPLFIAAMSPAVATHVPAPYAERFLVADRPDNDSMLRALDALRDRANQLESARRAQ